MADNRNGSNVNGGTKEVLGLTITQPSPARLCTIKDEDSQHSITPPHTAHDEKASGLYNASPYSNSTPPRSSMEVYKSESKQGIIATHSDAEIDLEAGHRSLEANGGEVTLLPSKCSKMSKICTKDPAWPSREDRKQERLQLRRSRANCGWWVGLDTKKRNTIKALIFLVLIGLIVGLAVGITKAVGGGVFSGDSTNKPIGH